MREREKAVASGTSYRMRQPPGFLGEQRVDAPYYERYSSVKADSFILFQRRWRRGLAR